MKNCSIFFLQSKLTYVYTADQIQVNVLDDNLAVIEL